MLSKEEVETCKEELQNYIEFMESAGDNAGWARGLKWYIDQLETREQKLIEYIEKKIREYDETIIELVLQNVLAVAKGEKE